VARTQFSFLEILLKSVGLFQVIYFVFKKATKPLGSRDKKYWLDIIGYLFIMGFLLNVMFLVNMEVRFLSVYQGDLSQWETRYDIDKVTCSDFFWIFNSVNEFIQTMIFCYVVRKIEVQVMRHIMNEIGLYGYDLKRYESET
jgi:hypothetical protein